MVNINLTGFQADGKLSPSITASLLSELDSSKDNSAREETIQHVAGFVYCGEFVAKTPPLISHDYDCSRSGYCEGINIE